MEITSLKKNITGYFPISWISRVRTKLALLFSLLIAAISFFIFIFFPSRLEQQSLTAIDNKSHSITEMLAYSMSAPLLFEDHDAMEVELNAIKQNKDVLYVIVLDAKGNTFASYNKSGIEEQQTLKAKEHRHLSVDERMFVTMASITSHNETIGELYIGFSIRDMKEQISESRKAIALVSILIFIIGMIAVISISAVISSPLKDMVKTAESIAKGDLSRRASVTTQNEIGQLAVAFNTMLQSLEEAYTELEHINRTLEQRVQERTETLREEIQQRNRIAEQLQTSEERYRRLVELSPDAIVIHSEGSIVFINTAGVKLVGGEHASEIIGRSLLDFVHPVSREIVRERIRRMTVEGKDVPMIEQKFLKLDGGVIDVEVAAAPFPYQGTSAVQVVVRDITERKRAEQALRESEERYRRFFEEDLTGDYISSPTGKLLECNPAFAQIFGFHSVEEALKSDMVQLYSSAHKRGEFLELLQKEKRLEYYEIEMRRMDGQPVYIIENVIGKFNDRNELVEIKGYLFDDTKRKNLEEQLRQAQKMESIGILAGGIAHDFNNLLGIIMGYTQILERRKNDPEKMQQNIDAIDKTVQRGANLVRQMLTFARKTEIKVEQFNLKSLLEEIAKMVEQTFPKTITCSYQSEDIPAFTADSNQVHQALLNLCVNARDAMPQGGTITITAKAVPPHIVKKKIRDPIAMEYVCLSVSDSGEGMDEQTRKRVFEPFFTTKEKGKGTGLGLAVVYGIVKNHDGYVDVESERGKGTTFHLYFPFRSQSTESIIIPEDVNQSEVGVETILIVEDEEMLGDVLKSSLEESGYSVLWAKDGIEAVEMYRKNYKNIDLVLSDMGLPKQTGETSFYQMKEINPAVKTIFASGYIEPEIMTNLFKAGVKDFIQKPYNQYKILKKIRDAIEGK